MYCIRCTWSPLPWSIWGIMRHIGLRSWNWSASEWCPSYRLEAQHFVHELLSYWHITSYIQPTIEVASSTDLQHHVLFATWHIPCIKTYIVVCTWSPNGEPRRNPPPPPQGGYSSDQAQCRSFALKLVALITCLLRLNLAGDRPKSPFGLHSPRPEILSLWSKSLGSCGLVAEFSLSQSSFLTKWIWNSSCMYVLRT